jgi:hypothetical protein
MNIIEITNILEPKHPLVPLKLEDIKYIIIHHLKAKSATWQDIDRWHREQSWDCIGYNEYIKKDGTVYICRGDNVGAHCAGYNSVSYGIACEGDYDAENTMPQAQFDALVSRINFNKAIFLNYKCTVAHSYFYDTACPGKYFPLAQVLEAIVPTPNNDHWAQKPFDKCIAKGYVVNETRFDDDITRGEVFALLAQDIKRN